MQPPPGWDRRAAAMASPQTGDRWPALADADQGRQGERRARGEGMGSHLAHQVAEGDQRGERRARRRPLQHVPVLLHGVALRGARRSRHSGGGAAPLPLLRPTPARPPATAAGAPSLRAHQTAPAPPPFKTKAKPPVHLDQLGQVLLQVLGVEGRPAALAGHGPHPRTDVAHAPRLCGRLPCLPLLQAKRAWAWSGAARGVLMHAN